MFSLFWQLCAVRVLFSCIRGHLNRNALKLKTFLAVAVNMPLSHFVRRSQTAVRKLQPDVPKPVGVAPIESILRRKDTNEKPNENTRIVFESRAFGRRWIYYVGKSRSMGQENDHDRQ